MECDATGKAAEINRNQPPSQDLCTMGTPRVLEDSSWVAYRIQLLPHELWFFRYFRHCVSSPGNGVCCGSYIGAVLTDAADAAGPGLRGEPVLNDLLLFPVAHEHHRSDKQKAEE